MATTSEAVLSAVWAALSGGSGALADAEVLRNHGEPIDIPAGGLVILYDGDPGEPEILLSPLTYAWQHRAEIELFVQAGTAAARDLLFDQLRRAIAVALSADRTFGGLIDWSEALAPEPFGEAVEGGASIKQAIIPLVLHYDTDDGLADVRSDPLPATLPMTLG